MTATPRYYTGRVRKAAQDAEMYVASMDDPTRFGEVFHRLSFGEAISRKLLTDYQVAIVGVDNATYREWVEKGTLVMREGKATDARTLASQIGLAKAMRKYDLCRDEVVAQLGYEHLRRHDLRHTGLTWFADAGVPLHRLQRIAGHSDPRITQRYLHPDLAALRDDGDRLTRHLRGDAGPGLAPNLRVI